MVIKKLPAFLIVDEKGQIINENAKCLPDLPAKASDFPFPPPPIGLLSSADRIVKPAMCLMLENCTPELQNQIIETIKPIAETWRLWMNLNTFWPIGAIFLACWGITKSWLDI